MEPQVEHLEPRNTLWPRAHPVRCIHCGGGFDLFAAPWCSHPAKTRSKRCPSCGRCVCAHPAYGDARLWADAPGAFRRHGFNRLFVFYL
jgi:hypothetical protein